jgi:hypothetical protein
VLAAAEAARLAVEALDLDDPALALDGPPSLLRTTLAMLL